MSIPEGDNDEPKSGRRAPGHREADAMIHLDFDVLLGYAEGTFERAVNRRIAAHVLICESCSTDLQYIETELLSAAEFPLSDDLPEDLRLAAPGGLIAEAGGMPDFAGERLLKHQEQRAARTLSAGHNLESMIEGLNQGWRDGTRPKLLKKFIREIETFAYEEGTSIEARLRGLSSVAMVKYALGKLQAGNALGAQNWKMAKEVEPECESELKWMASYGYFYSTMFLGLVEPSMQMMAEQWSRSYARLSVAKKEDLRLRLANKLPLNPVLSIPRHMCLAAALSDGPLFDEKFWPNEKAYRKFRPGQADREIVWLDAWYEEAKRICTSEPISLNLSHAYAGYYLTLLLPGRMQDTHLHDRIQGIFKSITDTSPVAQYVKHGFSGVYRLVCGEYREAVDSFKQASHFSTTSGNRFADCVFNCSYAVAAAHCADPILEKYVEYCLEEANKLANTTSIKHSVYKTMWAGASSVVCGLRGDDQKAQQLAERSKGARGAGRLFSDIFRRLCLENL